MVNDRADRVVVPSVGVIPQYERRRVLPLRQRLDIIDEVDQEGLFVDRIGLKLDAGVAILSGWRLDEADRRKVAALRCREKVGEVVLMVGAVQACTDQIGGAWRSVVRIDRRSEILERLMMRDVVLRREAADVGMGRSALAVDVEA